MSDQPSFWDELPPFQRHSQTSRLAAISMLPKAGTKRRMVLDDITLQGGFGATDDEIQIRLRMSGNTERPRRVELLEMGFIRDSGLKRRTSGGEWAVVWVINEAALSGAKVRP